jgi:hypothetical protein
MYSPVDWRPPWKVEVPKPETVRLFVTLKSVEVARVMRVTPKVVEAEVKVGAETTPLAVTVKRLVVAEPEAFVDEAIAKSGSALFTTVRWIERSANGVVVPTVRTVAKRFWRVDDAVAMMPPLKLIKVEVASQVFSVVNGKDAVRADASEVDETLLLNVVQSADVRSPRTVPEDEGMLNVKVPPAFVIPQSLLIAVDDVAKVSAPVCAEPKDCAKERTPVLVTLPFKYVRPEEKVVVAAA